MGYSYISCAWYAFPFEAMEVFTFFSLQVEKLQQQSVDQYLVTRVQVGAAKFVADHAPPGMLATVTGLQGGAHNGLGKGFGGLLGGFTIETTKSTHKAFRLFGFSCAGVSVLYILIVSLTALRRRYRPRPARDGKVSSLSRNQPWKASLQMCKVFN